MQEKKRKSAQTGAFSFFVIDDLRFTIYELLTIYFYLRFTLRTIVNLLQLNNQSYLVNRQIVNKIRSSNRQYLHAVRGVKG